MPTREFLTVADELLETAEAAVDHFEELGYTVQIEKRELGHPFVATFRAKRSSTVNIVEVAGSVDLDRLHEWVSYGKSCNSDTRVNVALPPKASLTATATKQLRKLGVGVLVLDEDDSLDELFPPQDLALNVALPTLVKDSQRLRNALGPAWETFKRNQWREGFEEACKALEKASKDHLWKGLQAGRIVVLTDAGNPRSLTRVQVDRMTLGALEKAFENIHSQNHSDKIVGATLKVVLKERNLATHEKRKAASERALRDNVGNHMWRIVMALREIYP